MRFWMYGWKNVPRLEAWYGPWDYPYANGVVLTAAPMPDCLQAVITANFVKNALQPSATT